MNRPLFNITASVRLDITVGAASRAIYFALLAQYQFGVPIIYARAPAELATTYGLTLYSAVGDPGIQSTVPGVVVVWFPYPHPTVVGHDSNGNVVFTRTVSTSDAGGTLVNVNYVDANGRLWVDVDWQWTISVEGYSGTGSLGRWDQQIVTWTGDGTAGRLIPTTFALNHTGTVAIWILPTVGFNPCFRHNGAMAGTMITNSAVDPLGGIMSFGATGFTITNHGSIHVNDGAATYTAVVLSDTSGRYMKVGSYPGWGVGGGSGTFFGSGGTPSSTVNPALGFIATDSGRVVDVVGSGGQGPFVITITGPTTADVNPGALFSGGHNITFRPANDVLRQIDTGFPAVAPFSPTQVWVYGQGSPSFRSSDFTGANSVQFVAAGVSLTQAITNILGSIFQVGTNSAVNNQGVQAYFVAFSIPVGDVVWATLFQTYKATGTGALVPVVLGFQPAFVTARVFDAVSADAAWRGPLHAGTVSQGFPNLLFTYASGGIQVMGASGFSLGTTLAPSGKDVYGFALAGAGGAEVGTPFVPAELPDNPGPSTPGVPLPAIDGGTGAGCSATMPAIAEGAGDGCSSTLATATDDSTSTGGVI